MSCSFLFHDEVHSVPKFEIHVDNNLSFTIRVMLWSLPDNHNIYVVNNRSLRNITLSNLIKSLTNFNMLWT